MNHNNIESILRNVKFVHLTDDELDAYRDNELGGIPLVRGEAHLKLCIICERRLEVFREEQMAIYQEEITSDDIAMVNQLLQQIPMRKDAPPSEQPNVLPVPLRERLSKALRLMGESLQDLFKKTSGEELLALQCAPPEEKVRKVWECQEPDSSIKGAAFLDINGDLQFIISSEKMELQGTRLRLRIKSTEGEIEQEVTLQPMSKTEVGAMFELPRNEFEFPSEQLQVSFEMQEG